MNLAGSLKVSTQTMLDSYIDNDGVSEDPYTDQQQFHPMAEGKYLQTIAALTRSRLITRHKLNQLVTQSLRRLNDHVISVPNGYAFGLNFSYADIPADEPYLITTAMVTNGLLDCEELISDSELLQPLIGGCLQYLRGVECLQVNDKWNIAAPVYSPRKRLVIYNAVAYWAMVLHRSKRLPHAHHDMDLKVAEWLAYGCRKPSGWPYEEGAARYDLIHTCLILNCLAEILSSQSVEKMAIPILAHFTVSNGHIDKFESVNHDDAMSICARSSSVVARFHTDEAVIYHNEPARAWGLGELLVFMAAMAEKGDHRDYWMITMKRTAAAILVKLDSKSKEGGLDKPWFRYTMFLSHGFSSVLEVMRKL